MSDISPSKIQTDVEFEAKISRMDNFEEIRKAMRDRAIEQNLVRPDNDPFYTVEVNQPAPTTFEEIVEIPGVVKGTITGTSELDLAQKVTAFYRDRAGWNRDAKGRFVQQQQQEQQPIPVEIPGTEQEMTAALAEARQKVQLGTLTAEEFLELKQELTSGLQEQREWRAAVETFRNSAAGSDWPGMESNMRLMTDALAELGMIDGLSAEEKLAALTGAWNQMKSTDTYFKPQASPAEIAERLADAAIREAQQAEYAKELAGCKSQSDVDEVNARYRDSLGLQTNQGSTFWGSR